VLLKVVAYTLMVGGLLVAVAARMVAGGAAMDMDPPYESLAPNFWVAGGAGVSVYFGWRLLRGVSSRLRVNGNALTTGKGAGRVEVVLCDGRPA
jgi:hypothetical protein